MSTAYRQVITCANDEPLMIGYVRKHCAFPAPMGDRLLGMLSRVEGFHAAVADDNSASFVALCMAHASKSGEHAVPLEAADLQLLHRALRTVRAAADDDASWLHAAGDATFQWMVATGNVYDSGFCTFNAGLSLVQPPAAQLAKMAYEYDRALHASTDDTIVVNGKRLRGITIEQIWASLLPASTPSCKVSNNDILGAVQAAFLALGGVDVLFWNMGSVADEEDYALVRTLPGWKLVKRLDVDGEYCHCLADASHGDKLSGAILFKRQH
ncbi:hypothetical protein AB1Y20_013747 [Prymnesium parvum]|uniref:Uncharacterized protein n=1 Tax=Prymnesium parvum TaxID=97485 RepID=A0AB34IJ31_PRYPA